jgi:hypothetical protein
VKVFVVQAYRYSDFDKHSYVVGVYSSKKDAEAVAEREEDFRGGKYGCVVYEFELDNRDIDFNPKIEMSDFFEKENREAITNRIKNAELLMSEKNNGEPDDWQ